MLNRSAARIALCCFALLGASACSSSSGSSTPTPSAAVTTTVATSPTTGGSVADTVADTATSATTVTTLVQNPLPDSVPNDPDVRKNVAQTKCAAVDGGWGAEGTATNPGTAAVTYSITVYFTTPTATALDFGSTTVKVEPGATENWTISKQFAAVADMLCPMVGISLV